MSVCEKLGINLPTYMHICISRLIQGNGISFSTTLNEVPENKGIKATNAAGCIAAECVVISDEIIEEINVGISEVRK